MQSSNTHQQAAQLPQSLELAQEFWMAVGGGLPQKGWSIVEATTLRAPSQVESQG
jgi:hypothetical protein